MPQGTGFPAVSKIRLYPIKSLNPVEVSEARIGRTGGLQHDRVWALYASDGRWINGKHTPAVHFIEARFAADLGSVDLSISQAASREGIGPARATFAFPADTAGATQWFSAYFAEPVTVRHSENGFPDDDLAPGPTIVSTASLQAVCSWFPQISLESARLRFRANLYLEGLAPWRELDLVGREIAIGPVRLKVAKAITRCAAVNVNPSTGVRDLNIPRALEGGIGHANMGVYAEVLSAGEIEPGASCAVAAA